jgi:hypothetical protein
MCKRTMKQSPARQTSISSHRAVTETRWLLIKQMKGWTRIVNGGSSCNTEAHDNDSYLQANWKKKSSLHCEWNHKLRSISCFLSNLQIHVRWRVVSCVCERHAEGDSAFHVRNCRALQSWTIGFGEMWGAEIINHNSV